MILAIDIGNTHTVLGVFDEGVLRAHWRVGTDRQKTEDEYGLQVLSMFGYAGIKPQEITGAAIASVVPPLTPVFEKMVRSYLGCSPLIIGPGVRTGINIRYEHPKDVGPDRIANAVAAYQKYGGPVIVVDFGTATTLDVISKDAEYLGGAIAPGILTATEALFEKTARLPRIELQRPPSAIGRNTVASMQAGIIFGFAGQVDELVRRVSRELGGKPYVVATGGLANLVAPESKTIQTVDPYLTLEGLYIVYKRNAEQPSTAESGNPRDEARSQPDTGGFRIMI
ncbi:MAG: type III pantothenate kinase [Firmicutes bacterium]|nr:type III pantothenate kinase [Candidatus Fermentithermobacillaceae bacterium]